jgi:hypothetical protein
MSLKKAESELILPFLIFKNGVGRLYDYPELIPIIHLKFQPVINRYEFTSYLIEAISKIGFWFKFAAGTRFKPKEYFRISRI